MNEEDSIKNSIMFGLLSQSSMLLCGMHGNNPCSSHRTISVKIETCFGRRAKFCFMSAVDYFIFSIHVLHFVPKYYKEKKRVAKRRRLQMLFLDMQYMNVLAFTCT